MDVKELEDKYISILKNDCNSGDVEGDHWNADKEIMNLLKELGMNKLVDTFEEIYKWYS